MGIALVFSLTVCVVVELLLRLGFRFGLGLIRVAATEIDLLRYARPIILKVLGYISLRGLRGCKGTGELIVEGLGLGFQFVLIHVAIIWGHMNKNNIQVILCRSALITLTFIQCGWEEYRMVYADTFKDVEYVVDGQACKGDLYLEVEVDSLSDYSISMVELTPHGKQSVDLTDEEFEALFPQIFNKIPEKISEHYADYGDYLRDMQEDR